jgi:hypothetical protein
VVPIRHSSSTFSDHLGSTSSRANPIFFSLKELLGLNVESGKRSRSLPGLRTSQPRTLKTAQSHCPERRAGLQSGEPRQGCHKARLESPAPEAQCSPYAPDGSRSEASCYHAFAPSQLLPRLTATRSRPFPYESGRFRTHLFELPISRQRYLCRLPIGCSWVEVGGNRPMARLVRRKSLGPLMPWTSSQAVLNRTE